MGLFSRPLAEYTVLSAVPPKDVVLQKVVQKVVQKTVARGTHLVIGLVVLGLIAALTGIWFQWAQTRRCLAFYGPAAAKRISAAPRVELWTLAPRSLARGEKVFGEHAPGRLMALHRQDISNAKGLVHLRRGLVEDANFVWSNFQSSAATYPAAERLPVEAWDIAIAFSDSVVASGEPTILAIDLGDQNWQRDQGDQRDQRDQSDRRGAITVVGRPGRIGLGRIGPGLRKWIDAEKATPH